MAEFEVVVYASYRYLESEEYSVQVYANGDLVGVVPSTFGLAGEYLDVYRVLSAAGWPVPEHYSDFLFSGNWLISAERVLVPSRDDLHYGYTDGEPAGPGRGDSLTVLNKCPKLFVRSGRLLEVADGLVRDAGLPVGQAVEAARLVLAAPGVVAKAPTDAPHLFWQTVFGLIEKGVAPESAAEAALGVLAPIANSS